MGFIVSCPLNNLSCEVPIKTEKKSFFLAEAENPLNAQKRRREAISTVLEREHGYKIKSALDESTVNAFTCKICKLIQACAYGVADITAENPNVLLELGMMIALGKPVIILRRKTQKQKLILPSNIIDREVIPFEDYIEILPKLRKMVENLPPPVSPIKPVEDLKKIAPEVADNLRKMGANIVKQFKDAIEEAKLDTISPKKEEREIPSELDERLGRLEEKIGEMSRLGFATDAKTAFLRGNYLYNREEYEEALAAYNWSLQLKPDDPTTLNNRGITYDKLKRYDEALADYNRSLELRPDDPDTLNNRGLTYRHLKRYNEALADFNHSLELRPDHPAPLGNRGTTYDDLEKHDEALADYNRSLELRPDHPDTLYNRGTTYLKLKRYDEALADFNHSLEIRPDDPGTLYNLACLFSLWEKTNDALAYFEKAIEANEKYREDAKTDKDFDNIRDDLRFKKLTESD